MIYDALLYLSTAKSIVATTALVYLDFKTKNNILVWNVLLKFKSKNCNLNKITLIYTPLGSGSNYAYS